MITKTTIDPGRGTYEGAYTTVGTWAHFTSSMYHYWFSNNATNAVDDRFYLAYYALAKCKSELWCSFRYYKADNRGELEISYTNIPVDGNVTSSSYGTFTQASTVDSYAASSAYNQLADFKIMDLTADTSYDLILEFRVHDKNASSSDHKFAFNSPIQLYEKAVNTV